MTNSRYYAGIGSRQTPQNILYRMNGMATVLEAAGYTLRSGGAKGADRAFELGVIKKEILKPKDATEDAICIASEYHPAWNKCNDYVRKLHGRNVQIILGRNLDQPVEFVVCWTVGGKSIGGTGLGLRIADSYKIKIYNLAIEKELLMMTKFIEECKK